MIKVFLVLMVLAAGAQQPDQQGYEVTGENAWVECGKQLAKLTEQPPPDGDIVQASCVMRKMGVRS